MINGPNFDLFTFSAVCLQFLFVYLQDHTLRMFRLEDHMAVFTLHGHLGPVTSAFIDKEEPSSACSGSQVKILCIF